MQRRADSGQLEANPDSAGEQADAGCIRTVPSLISSLIPRATGRQGSGRISNGATAAVYDRCGCVDLHVSNLNGANSLHHTNGNGRDTRSTCKAYSALIAKY
jgi:hypothetical protein